MSYDSIPNFDDPMAKVKEGVHHPSGAKRIDILYGAQNPDGSPKSPEKEKTKDGGDGHGHFIALEIDGLMQGISWRHSEEEGPYDEYLGSKRAGKRDENSTKPLEEEGVDRHDTPLMDLEDDIRKRRDILRDLRRLMSSRRYSTVEADELFRRFDAVYDMGTPVERDLKRQYEELFRRNQENSRRFQEQDGNAAQKRDLIVRAKSYQNSSEWRDTSQRMKELMDAWKRLGYAGEDNDRLWEEFRRARQVFYDRLRRHSEEMEALRQDRKAKKRQLISDARDLTRNVENWKAAHEKLEALLDKWKRVGSAGREDDERLWSEFQEVRNDFYARRQKAREDQEREFEARRKAKWELIAEAQSYAGSGDYSQGTAERMKALSDAWKRVGFSGKDSDDQLWSRFRQAQDAYWGAKKEAGARRRQEWREKTQAAIDRRRESIAKIQRNIANLHQRLGETWNSNKQEEIRRWIDENEGRVWELEQEIYKMEQELGRG